MDHKNDTPLKPRTPFVNRVLAHSKSCDSPFGVLPNVSTPPSRYKRIVNPFDSHLLERLHLPTFSPSVFAQGSTPKTTDKFKWTIDDISSLKPADIDATTLDQHVNDHDPTVEHIVQQKINAFFNDKIIVPSPLNDDGKKASPLLQNGINRTRVQVLDVSTQTILTFPPKLPAHIEEVLRTYCNFNEDQQGSSSPSHSESILYHKLFGFDESEAEERSPAQDHHNTSSLQSSPALSTGLSPINLSPIYGGRNANDRVETMSFGGGSLLEMPELRECNLSPIVCRRSPDGTNATGGASSARSSSGGGSSREQQQGNSRTTSACRLSFSGGHMSIDASMMVVPNSSQLPSNQSILCYEDRASQTPSPQELLLNDSTTTTNNWDMEFNEVSFLSRSPPPHQDDEDIEQFTNCRTPHSKLFAAGAQRKRLSDSFRQEEMMEACSGITNTETEDLMSEDNNKEHQQTVPVLTRKIKNSRLLSADDVTTDAGYHTGGATLCEENLSSATWDGGLHSTHMFASTPTKGNIC